MTRTREETREDLDRALRRRGIGYVTRRAEIPHLGAALTLALGSCFALTYALMATDDTKNVLPLTIAIFAGMLIVSALLLAVGEIADACLVPALLVIGLQPLLWIGTAIYRLFHNGLHPLLSSHLVGLGVGVLVFAIGSVSFRALATSVSFLFPLVLLILFAPLVTSDGWEIAYAMHGARFPLVFGLLTIAPLIALGRQVRPSVDRALANAWNDLSTRPAEEIAAEVALVLEREPKARASPHSDYEVHLKSALKDAAWDWNDQRHSQIRALLIWNAVRGIVGVLLGGFCLLFVFIYAVSWTMISTRVVGRWLEITHGLPGLPLGLPGGPYLQAAALFATVGTAVFLGLSVTDPAYSEKVAAAVMGDDTRTVLALWIARRRI